jgi:glycosyltransferase involved in cell wall biosynthesis
MKKILASPKAINTARHERGESYLGHTAIAWGGMALLEAGDDLPMVSGLTTHPTPGNRPPNFRPFAVAARDAPTRIGGGWGEQPRIRICHLINDLDAGGAERTLVNVVRHLDPSRFSNEVISLIEPGVFGHDLRTAGIPLTSLGMRRGRPTLSGLARAVRHLRRSRPTVLQTWLYHADLLGTVAHFFAPSASLLWNVRCTDLATSPGSSRLLWITRLLARFSAQPDAVIVNSKPGQLFHQEIGYRPRRWIELPNGVDTQKFRPRFDMREKLRALLGIPAQGPVIGMVARYHPMKDHATFLQASAKFARDCPDASFVLCGIDCDSRNENLNRLILQAGLCGRVTLLGLRSDMRTSIPPSTS